jgi:CRP-like cAMP-binding protein
MNQRISAKLSEHFGKYEVEVHPKGKILTYANQEPKGISFLIKGVVEQYDITPEGNRITVNVFKPPAFFPMSWAINKTPNIYFFGALTDVELRQADANKTVAFLQTNPDVMFDLLSRVYKGTDALLRRLMLATSGVAANRLVFELLIEAYRFGIEVDGTKRLIKVRQGVLAARSGLARETVSRELQKLEKGKLISRTSRGIVINIKSLEKIYPLSE